MESSRSTREQQPWSYSCSFTASFAWPPRSYPCSFCRREFRSAQALGGHMNVHRRDRARLRHCSPPPPPPHPAAAAVNPNPRSAAAAPPSDPIPNLNYPPPPPPMLYHPKRSSSLATKARAVEAVDLELGVGVQYCCAAEDDGGGLDLELRLGCS